MDELERRREQRRKYRQVRDAERKAKQKKMKNRLMPVFLFFAKMFF